MATLTQQYKLEYHCTVFGSYKIDYSAAVNSNTTYFVNKSTTFRAVPISAYLQYYIGYHAAVNSNITDFVNKTTFRAIAISAYSQCSIVLSTKSIVNTVTQNCFDAHTDTNSTTSSVVNVIIRNGHLDSEIRAINFCPCTYTYLFIYSN